MLLWADNAATIRKELLANCDPAHVDSCDWNFDRQTGVFSADFVSERFAVCTMTKQLSVDAQGISSADIKMLAEYASSEIERNLNEMGCMSMFNLSTEVEPAPLPEGVRCTLVVEELTQEKAEEEEEANGFWASLTA